MRREGYSHAIEVLFRWKVCAFFCFIFVVGRPFRAFARISTQLQEFLLPRYDPTRILACCEARRRGALVWRAAGV